MSVSGEKIFWATFLVLALVLTSCQPPPSTSTPDVEKIDVGAQLEPRLLTEVHLQAVYEIPSFIEGMKPSHDEMRYLLYLPDGYWDDEDRLWPMIFFLHGAGGDDNDSSFVMSMGLPEVLYAGDQPDDFPFVVVSPQAFPNTAWWVGDTLAILNALIEEVISIYRVDPDRVYLTGLSMGGYGSWILATTYPEKFAAMVSVSGSGYRTSVIPGKDILCKLKDIPVWAIHGAQDMISALEPNKIFVFALKSMCLGEVKWTVYDDLGHGGTYRKAYRDPAIYKWMLEHSR